MTHDEPRIREMVAAAIDDVRSLVSGLTDGDLVQPSGCAGWRVADAIVHLRLDAEAVLISLASPTADPADRDFATYWGDWPAKADVGFGDVRWIWASTASHADGTSLRSYFEEVADAASSTIRRSGVGRFAFQGHVLEAGDLLTMWGAEFALHHLDLIANLPDRNGPSTVSLQLVETTLDAILGGARVDSWDLLAYVCKATGRQPLTPSEHALLGAASVRYPAFG